MPRFVMLEHDHPHLHWDLMLETGDVLRTWRLARPPEDGVLVEAVPLGDHRKLYLDYEGPLCGNRGSVVQWDAGIFEQVFEGTDAVQVVLSGRKIRGSATLRQGAGETWTFLFRSAAPPEG